MKRVSALLAVAMLVGAFAAPGSAASGNQSLCQGWFITQATIELPPGYWDDGEHFNTIRFVDPSLDLDETWGPFEFTVSDSAPLYKGQVWVAAGLIGAGWASIPDQTINPAQDTVLWAGWVIGPSDFASLPAAHEWLANTSILFSWDGGEELLARQGPLTNVCANYGQAAFRRTWSSAVNP